MKEILMYPTFMADSDSEETKLLKLEYLRTREEILSYYQGRDFFEANIEFFKKNSRSNQPVSEEVIFDNREKFRKR